MSIRGELAQRVLEGTKNGTVPSAIVDHVIDGLIEHFEGRKMFGPIALKMLKDVKAGK